MTIDRKEDEHPTSNIQRPTSNEKTSREAGKIDAEAMGKIQVTNDQ